MNFRNRSIAPPTSSLWTISAASRERATMSPTRVSIRREPLEPSAAICSAGRSASARIPARTASSMSWLM